jgi:hypothetical protein
VSDTKELGAKYADALRAVEDAVHEVRLFPSMANRDAARDAIAAKDAAWDALFAASTKAVTL